MTTVADRRRQVSLSAFDAASSFDEVRPNSAPPPFHSCNTVVVFSILACNIFTVTARSCDGEYKVQLNTHIVVAMVVATVVASCLLTYLDCILNSF